MAFLGIDKERLSYLVANGTQEGELKKFFSECHQRLVAKGARIQNLPHGRAARIRAICEKLPAQTDPVLKGWFGTNISMVDAVSVDEIISDFELYEDLEDVIPVDQGTRLSRSALVHLFSDEPPAKLLAFLRTQIGSHGQLVQPVPGQPQTDPPAVVDTELPAVDLRDTFIELVPAILENEDIGDLLDQLPAELGAYVAGLRLARSGDLEAAHQVAATLAPGGKPQQLLLRAIKRVRAADIGHRSETGMEIVTPPSFSGEFESCSDSVLGYCTNSERTSAVFVQAIGVVRQGTVFLLSVEKRIEMFPETGDVMAFAGSNRPKQPTRGEIGLWKVAEHDTKQKVHFHLESEVANVYEICRIPFYGVDSDSVREFIKSVWAGRRADPMQFQLYCLADGMVIAPKNIRAELSKDDAFDQPFNAWRGLSGIMFEGRALIVGPLPAPSEVYDCAPLAAALGQLARAAVKQNSAHLTKDQIKELVASFQSSNVGVNAQRLRRITEQLTRLTEDNDALDDAASVLFQHPSVEQRIAAGVDAEIRSRASAKLELQREMEILKGEKGKLEAKIKELLAQHKRAAADAASVVKAAFDKAVNNGIEALANAAVVNALRVPSEGAFANVATSNSSTVNAISIGKVDHVHESSLLEFMSGFGIDRRTSSGILSVVKLARECGFAVCFRGVAARLVVKALAGAFGEEAWVAEIEIGLIDPKTLAEVLSQADRNDAIAIIEANISALELYGRALIDQLVIRAAESEAIGGPLILLTLSSSSLALPLPSAISSLSIQIDLDSKIDFNSPSQDYDDSEDEPAQGVRYIRTRALRQLREKTELLDEPLKSVVSRILKVGLA